MVRLTRAQQQERNRTAVLAAARAEFAERGYGDAKVDRIAERAELTRGAVYSNFPSKRALYLAVLLSDDRVGPAGTPPPPPADLPGALGAFARSWLERLPLAGESPGEHPRRRSLTGVFDDEPGRAATAGIAALEALLLGLALERHHPGTRRVRLAELALTLLAGAGAVAEQAPGFGDPFDVTRACEHLAGLALDDAWRPPHLPFVTPAHAVEEPWPSLDGLTDLVGGGPVDLGGDGVLAVLGVARLGAAEEAVRGARRGERVTVVVVTGDPAELGRLVRLRVRDLVRCLPGGAAGPSVVVDDGSVAAALGVRDADDTEAAVRVHGGGIVARASGRGAGHAAATATDRAGARR